MRDVVGLSIRTSRKGKPRKSEGRKGTDLKLIEGEGGVSFRSYDSRTAEES